MSYCRIGSDSDVYMFEAAGFVVCWLCKLDSYCTRKIAIKRDGRLEALAHLLEHVAAKHLVPPHALAQLAHDVGTRNSKAG